MARRELSHSGSYMSYLGMQQTQHLIFALCPQAPLFSIASALEVLRHANRACGFEAYSWSLVTENDAYVVDTAGIRLEPSCALQRAPSAAAVYVVAGFGAANLRPPRMLRWLARQAQSGAIMGGISNGSFLLAQAGLLDSYQATVHWEDFPHFVQSHPAVHARYQRYVFDRDRRSCSGAASTLDMFLELIRREQGIDVAIQITRQMLLQAEPVHTTETDIQAQQAIQYSPRLQRALSVLEACGDAPPQVAQLAREVGMSRRALQDLFQREVGHPPKHLLKLRRLGRAQALVRFSDLSLAAVAGAVGFSSQSHMTTLYKAQFKATPAQDRRRFHATQTQ